MIQINNRWMANQIVIDSLKNSYSRAVPKVYPSNFISDAKKRL
jgi:hypothetical protein